MIRPRRAATLSALYTALCIAGECPDGVGRNFRTSPDEVVEKILFEHELFGHQRFLAQISVGPMPHAKVMRAIELFGTVVALAVRKALRNASAAS